MRLAVISVVLLCGCTLGEAWRNTSLRREPEPKLTPGQQFEVTLNSWIGDDIDGVVQRIGYPAREIKAPNGNRVFVFEGRSVRNMPTYTMPTNTTYREVGKRTYSHTNGGLAIGGYQQILQCDVFFEVDASTKIVRTAWQGNSCF
jgi:hypothetical protein